MRSFEDENGGTWDVAIERASYGTHLLIFAHRGTGALRRGMLEASTFEQAQREFEALSAAGLRARLERADPWEAGA